MSNSSISGRSRASLQARRLLRRASSRPRLARSRMRPGATTLPSAGRRPGRADAGLRLGSDIRDALRRQRPLRLRLVAEEPRRDPDRRLQCPDRCGARPARGRDRRLERRARSGLRYDLVQRQSRRRKRDGRLAHVRELEALRLAFTSPGADGGAGSGVDAADGRARDECRHAVHGGPPGHGRDLVVLSDRRALGEPEWPWSATLATPIASGATSASFYFRDAGTGSTTITAAAAGKTAATQTSRSAPLPRLRCSVGWRRSRSRSRRAGGATPAAPAVGDTITYTSPSGTSVARLRVRSSPSSCRHRSRTQVARPTADRAAPVRRLSLRPRLPLRRSRRDRTDQRRCARTRDAHLDGCFLGSARRPAAGERHRPRLHGRQASSGRKPAIVRPTFARPARRRGRRVLWRRDPVRPLLGRRLRPARGAPDDHDLDCARSRCSREARSRASDRRRHDPRPPPGSRARAPTFSRRGSAPPS